MKKLILLFGIILISCNIFGQTSVRMSSETVGTFTVDSDTMQILKSDNIVVGTVFVPSTETDSVTISGNAFEVDNITTSSIKIPPGVSFNFGFRYARQDSLNIACPGKAYIILLKDEN